MLSSDIFALGVITNNHLKHPKSLCALVHHSSCYPLETFLCLKAEGEFLLLTVNPCRLSRSSTWRRNSPLRCAANAATEMSSLTIGGILTGGGGGRRKTLFLRLSGRLTMGEQE